MDPAEGKDTNGFGTLPREEEEEEKANLGSQDDLFQESSDEKEDENADDIEEDDENADDMEDEDDIEEAEGVENGEDNDKHKHKHKHNHFAHKQTHGTDSLYSKETAGVSCIAAENGSDGRVMKDIEGQGQVSNSDAAALHGTLIDDGEDRSVEEELVLGAGSALKSEFQPTCAPDESAPLDSRGKASDSGQAHSNTGSNQGFSNHPFACEYPIDSPKDGQSISRRCLNPVPKSDIRKGQPIYCTAHRQKSAVNASMTTPPGQTKSIGKITKKQALMNLSDPVKMMVPTNTSKKSKKRKDDDSNNKEFIVLSPSGDSQPLSKISNDIDFGKPESPLISQDEYNSDTMSERSIDSEIFNADYLPIRDDFMLGDIVTEEEYLKNREEKLKQLLVLYRRQYEVLRENLLRRHNLLAKTADIESRTKETEQGITDPVYRLGKKFSSLKTEAEQKIAHAEIDALDKYIQSSQRRVCLYVDSGSQICCPGNVLFMSKYCYNHIALDANQKLFKRCQYADPFGTACMTPILQANVEQYCDAHKIIGDKRVQENDEDASFQNPSLLNLSTPQQDTRPAKRKKLANLGPTDKSPSNATSAANRKKSTGSTKEQPRATAYTGSAFESP